MSLERNNLEIGGFRFGIYGNSGRFKVEVGEGSDCVIFPTANDYDWNGGQFFSQEFSISDDQAEELQNFAEALLVGVTIKSREDLEAIVLGPLSDKAAELEEAYKTESESRAVIAKQTEDTTARTLLGSKFRGAETVNGIQIEISWYVASGNTRMQEVQNGGYEIYFPQIERGIDPYVSDQVIPIGKDESAARRVMKFACEKASQVKDVYELYKLVSKEVYKG